MTELAELRQRVKSVGARFRGTNEEDRKRSERLVSLLKSVEEGFARSQHENKRLNEELACANEEKQQIQAMLQTLLAEGEDTGTRGTGAAMRDLEDRIDRLVETASSVSGAASSDYDSRPRTIVGNIFAGGATAPEMTKDSPATVNTDEDDRTTARPEIAAEAAIRPSEEVLEEAPTASEEVESKPIRELESDTRETSTVIPILTDEAAEEGVFTVGEEKEPLDLTQMVTEERAGVKSNAGWRRLAADKDRMEIQQDIELISRALREGHDGRHQKQHWRRFLGGAN